MIGYYNYTVILTYLSVVSATIGMMCAIQGHYRLAISMLALSGFFDMFDGKVARRKLNRSSDEKLFGMQIDSLCDVVAFGYYPAVLCYSIGLQGPESIAVLIFYCVAAVIRLGFFNVLETNRQTKEDGANKYYYGLPVTSISVILPVTFLLNFVLQEVYFYITLTLVMAITGVLFITNFKLRKPSNKVLFVLVTIVVIVLIIAYSYRQFVFVKGPGDMLC